jgi:hypothetical protein
MDHNKHIISINNFVDEKLVCVDQENWELPRSPLFGSTDFIEDLRVRIGPFVMAVEFVLSVRSITLLLISYIMEISFTRDSYKIIRDALVDAADQLDSIYPIRAEGEERFRSRLQTLRAAICPSNIPAIEAVYALIQFLRDDREENFLVPIEDDREAFVKIAEIWKFMTQTIRSMYTRISQCSLQIIFAHFRCPRGYILFTPFIEKSGKPKTPERVRTTLTVPLLGAIYISMYYWHILEWNQSPGEELAFLLEDNKEGHHLGHFRQVAEDDIKAVSCRNMYFL